MAFRKFESFGARTTPKVSIRSNGQIGLSAGALRMFGILGKDWKVVLFFDEEAKLIGFKPTQDADEKSAIPVLVRVGKPNSTGAVAESGQISGKSFLETFQIKFKDKTRSFDPCRDEKNELFVIDLNKERASRRRKKDDPA